MLRWDSRKYDRIHCGVASSDLVNSKSSIMFCFLFSLDWIQTAARSLCFVLASGRQPSNEPIDKHQVKINNQNESKLKPKLTKQTNGLSIKRWTMWKLSKGYMKVKRWTFKLTPSQNPANQSITQVSRPQPCHACGFAAIYFHFRRRNFWIDGQARELHGWNDWIRLDYRVDSLSGF